MWRKKKRGHNLKFKCALRKRPHRLFPVEKLKAARTGAPTGLIYEAGNCILYFDDTCDQSEKAGDPCSAIKTISDASNVLMKLENRCEMVLMGNLIERYVLGLAEVERQ